jgi:hypothetical protein
MAMSVATITSICPAVSKHIHDDAVFVRMSPKEETWTIGAEPIESEADARKQSGTAGPSSVDGFKTSGSLGEYEWQQRLGGHDLNDFLLRAAVHADTDWITMAELSHKISLDGATYTEATGLLNLNALAGVYPVNLRNGWLIRIRNPSTGVYFICEVTETAEGSKVWALEPKPTTDLPLNITAAWEAASEFVKEGMTRRPIHCKLDQPDTDDKSAHYYESVDIATTKFGFAAKDSVRITLDVEGGGNAIIKKDETFPGETYKFPESHPLVKTSTKDMKVYINGVDESSRCIIASAELTITRGTEDDEAIGVDGGSCGNVLANIDVAINMDVKFKNSDLFINAAEGTLIGVVLIIPPSDGIGYALSVPSNTVSASLKDSNKQKFVDCTFSAQNNDDLGFQTGIFRFMP